MNIAFKGQTGCGKTLLMMRHVLYYLGHGYQPDEVWSTVEMLIPGVHFLRVAEVIPFLRRMIDADMKHLVVVLDEAERYFPERGYWDKEQSKAVETFWQERKLYLKFLWSAHKGRAVDKILRDSTHIEIIPRYEPEQDAIIAGVLHLDDEEIEYPVIYDHVSRVFPWYNSWATVR